MTVTWYCRRIRVTPPSAGLAYLLSGKSGGRPSRADTWQFHPIPSASDQAAVIAGVCVTAVRPPSNFTRTDSSRIRNETDTHDPAWVACSITEQPLLYVKYIETNLLFVVTVWTMTPFHMSSCRGWTYRNELSNNILTAMWFHEYNFKSRVKHSCKLEENIGDIGSILSIGKGLRWIWLAKMISFGFV